MLVGMVPDWLDVTKAVFPFEDADLSTDEFRTISRDEPDLLDLGYFFDDLDPLVDNSDIDGSTVFDLGDLFYEQDLPQGLGFEDASNTQSATQVKPCKSFCYSRMTSFVHAAPGNGMLCAVKCLAIDEREDRRLEKLLEVLDRLVDSQILDSPHTSLENPTKKNSGCVFLQEVFDIFCEDEKVHVIHSFYERNLGDSDLRAWFRLPTNSSSSKFDLDPDGIFFPHYQERMRQDIFFSLQVLTAELTLGLLFLHGRGIVHLGLSPSNIHATPSGHIQISNFGSANVLPRLLPGLVDLADVGSTTSSNTSDLFEASAVSLLSVPGKPDEVTSDGVGNDEYDCIGGRARFGSVVFGMGETIETSRYSAPELLERDDQGRLVFDEKADWWSLGMVLWELGYGEEGLGPEKVSEELDECLSDFLCQLINEHKKRLAGTDVKRHEFLAIEPLKWCDILDMEHPPCPPVHSTSSPPHDGNDDANSISVYSMASPVVVTGPPETVSVPNVGQRFESAFNATFADETTHSDVQPFPSTASLYRDIRTQPIQEEDEEEDSEFSLALRTPSPFANDSGLGPNEPLGSLLDDCAGVDIDDDGSPILIRVPSCGPIDFSFSPSFSLTFHDHESKAGKQWGDMSLDEKVALSLLQARGAEEGIPGPQTQAIVNLQRSGTGIGRRTRKVRGIFKASRRAVKFVSRFIFGVVRCR